MSDTRNLLDDYVTNGSEPAFRELVARYTNLVHSTASRLVDGDSHLAQDIAQTVFVDLARKAGDLSRDVTLGGWLHRHTCFVAASTLRRHRRRQSRERQAVSMNASDDHTAANLAAVAPVLDEAINQLDAPDRAAILLRFFEQLEFRAVGEVIGCNDDAARMRVSRALDKLHTLLKNRGVTLSATALGAVLAGGAVTTAPAGMAATLAGTALAGVATGGATAALVKFMTLTKLKIGIIGTLAIMAMAVPVVSQHQSLAKARAENQELHSQVEQITALQAENARLSNLVAKARDTAPPPPDQTLELARLRGEVTLLRDKTNQMAAALEADRQVFAGARVVNVAPPPPPTEAEARNQCINNLRLLDGAKQEWALTLKKSSTDTPLLSELQPWIGRGPKGVMPTCPSGGTYTPGRVFDDPPKCTIPGHVLN